MARWQKINQFLVVNGEGKIQPALGTFPADAYFDTRENCEVEVNLEIERGKQLECSGRDIYGEPVKTRYRQFRLTYNSPTPQQMFRMIAYKEGAVTSPTGTPANEVQTLTRSGTVSGGTFTLSFSLEGRSGTTKPIAWNASNAVILAALINAAASIGKVIKAGDVAVSGDWTGGVVLTFAKRLRNANLPLLTVDNTNITGGGSVAIAQTTAGDQNYHTAQRTDDGSKVLFGIALGNKADSTVTEKYGDCTVASINFTTDIEQTNVQMQVVINANFNPDAFTSFSVPACTNLPPCLAVDVRLKIDGTFKNRDLVNHVVNLDDNVPVAAMFGFDDLDISVAPVAGNEPVQEFTSEIFYDRANSNSVALRQLALDEHVEGNEVEFITHFGNPGNRVSVIAAEAKIKPQAGLDGFAGAAEQSTIRFIGTPYGKTGIPVTFEAYLDQDVAFLEE